MVEEQPVRMGWTINLILAVALPSISHLNIPGEKFLAVYRGQQAAEVEYCWLSSAFAVPNPGQIQLRIGTIVQWRIRPSLCLESKQQFLFYVVYPNSEYIQKKINCLERVSSELRKPLVNGTRPMNLVSEDTTLPKENRWVQDRYAM